MSFHRVPFTFYILCEDVYVEHYRYRALLFLYKTEKVKNEGRHERKRRLDKLYDTGILF